METINVVMDVVNITNSLINDCESACKIVGLNKNHVIFRESPEV